MTRTAVASLCLLLLPAFVPAASASNLAVGPATIARAAGTATATVRAPVAWDNAWRNERNHDAAWVFVKVRAGTGSWRHAPVVGGTPAAAGQPAATVDVPADGTGFFCFPSVPFRGTVRLSLEISVSLAGLGNIAPAAPLEARVFALEMVYVPRGPFTLGDPDPAALEYGAFFKSDGAGKPAGLFAIASESAFEVGPADGALYYQAQQPEYQGDRSGPVPAAFPKGFNPFYTMKYELLQGQYAEFLNTLGEEATGFRAIHGSREYYLHRGTIRVVDGRYVASSPARPANRVSWEDGIAFADWAGLRPMTELEFTKAARGPSTPIAHEYPWGTAVKEQLKRVMQVDDDLASSGDADESRLSDATRAVLGASFYWVMDLAGSVWERAVTIGHPRGRAFTGSHGDGRLTNYGSATNADWPRGDEAPGGYGYRGGGYYEQGMTDGAFNPYSPIAYRRFGAWGQAPRSLAYGFRAVRTAE
jgi:formylglycine-generating enzyme required for sulfatase activity